ncbi:glycoside hydrolase family 5 protein [Hyaloscypha variabilis F]|uniref:Glycoside hydrolase family 5 protein n=1 Tax=Hyaloscypha variabilis (strain UAMH 11265 / GT02V1 / F) TaxID=1149755 RepID=A0A2J6RSB1_HYAVF|nr:glycoside hydrolase family 5 protein [Hyaloscypha variabilis F]
MGSSTSKAVTGLLCTLTISCPVPISTATVSATRSFQPLPFSSSDRWIVDAKGNNVPVVGINWPGAADTMLPEGLGYQSIANIVQWLTDTGFNTVRLTFAIEMVDDILDNGGDVTLSDTLTQALGPANGTIILADILTNNPEFTANTTRLQVFDAVAAGLAAQNIYVHLDNHVSKAMWCCSLTDGNSWFGDTYFDTDKWIRGLSYMATHGKANWQTFSSMGLRNELRPALTGAPNLQPYTWSTWKTYMTAAASAIYSVNPEVLIYFSGLESDFNIEPAVGGSTLLDPGFSFDVASYEWAHKLVFEMHEYDENISSSCPIYEAILESFGADATTRTTGNRGPLVISEWGHDETDASDAWQSAYTECLTQFMTDRQLGWMLWVLAGSYYIRSGTQDYDETYGLLDHTWSDYRGVNSSAAIKQLVESTYAAYGQ